MVVVDNFIITFVIIIARVELIVFISINFLISRTAQKINHRVVKDLSLLVICQHQPKPFQSCLCRHRELWDFNWALRGGVGIQTEGGAHCSLKVDVWAVAVVAVVRDCCFSVACVSCLSQGVPSLFNAFCYRQHLVLFRLLWWLVNIGLKLLGVGPAKGFFNFVVIFAFCYQPFWQGKREFR